MTRKSPRAADEAGALAFHLQQQQEQHARRVAAAEPLVRDAQAAAKKARDFAQRSGLLADMERARAKAALAAAAMGLMPRHPLSASNLPDVSVYTSDDVAPSPLPTGLPGGPIPSPPSPPKVLSENQKGLLKAMLDLGATSNAKRRPLVEIATAFLGDDSPIYSSYKRDMAALKKAGFVTTTRGSKAGSWLTPKGVSQARSE